MKNIENTLERLRENILQKYPSVETYDFGNMIVNTNTGSYSISENGSFSFDEVLTAYQGYVINAIILSDVDIDVRLLKSFEILYLQSYTQQ